MKYISLRNIDSNYKTTMPKTMKIIESPETTPYTQGNVEMRLYHKSINH
jgi:hypothetical protein